MSDFCSTSFFIIPMEEFGKKMFQKFYPGHDPDDMSSIYPVGDYIIAKEEEAKVMREKLGLPNDPKDLVSFSMGAEW